MYGQDIWTHILSYLDILWPYRYVCRDSLLGHNQLVKYLEHELDKDHNKYISDTQVYMENLARSHQWNKAILLYLKYNDSHQLIPCHLAIIEGYESVARSIRYHFEGTLSSESKREYKEELLVLDAYFSDDNEESIARILSISTFLYVHLIKQEVFDNIIVPILGDEDQFSLFMYPHITFESDTECTDRFTELNNMFYQNDEYVLPRCPYEVSKYQNYRPSYIKEEWIYPLL